MKQPSTLPITRLLTQHFYQKHENHQQSYTKLSSHFCLTQSSTMPHRIRKTMAERKHVKTGILPHYIYDMLTALWFSEQHSLSNYPSSITKLHWWLDRSMLSSLILLMYLSTEAIKKKPKAQSLFRETPPRRIHKQASYRSPAHRRSNFRQIFVLFSSFVKKESRSRK